MTRRLLLSMLAATLLPACAVPAPSEPAVTSRLSPTPSAAATSPSAAPTVQPTPTATPAGGVYAATVSGELDPSVAELPPRVYVPNEESNDVAVIDPATFRVVGRVPVDAAPEHVTPDWGLQRLFVANMNGGTLTAVDPRTSQPVETVRLPIFPYALYYTLDGQKVMVVTNYISLDDVADNGVHFYDPDTWELLKYVQIPWPGADDGDLSADGSYFMISCEYSGMLAKIDTVEMSLVGSVEVGSLPRDVRLAPAGDVFFVANEGLDGVQVVDPDAMEVVGFIPTGDGTHGLEFSRDTTQMYVANRAAGSISVIDLASLTVVATWPVGGSPDEMTLSPDGSQLWASNRYHGSVSVVDTASGEVLATVATGANPHGLTYWPQPGRHSVGQNGNMR